MSPVKPLSSSQILSWRKNQLSKGGTIENLDWLLDIGGGLTWSDLQKIKFLMVLSQLKKHCQDLYFMITLKLEIIILIFILRRFYENYKDNSMGYGS